jgi:hypothetical protein
MRCAPALMIGALIALAAPSAVWAQLLATVMRLPSSPDAVLKKGLRKLVTAQEQFWHDHGTYTTDVSQLGFHKGGQRWIDSVWVQVLSAGGRSWSGRAIHRGIGQKSCVIYVGVPSDFPSGAPVTERDSVRATEEGVPVCDKF